MPFYKFADHAPDVARDLGIAQSSRWEGYFPNSIFGACRQGGTTLEDRLKPRGGRKSIRLLCGFLGVILSKDDLGKAAYRS